MIRYVPPLAAVVAGFLCGRRALPFWEISPLLVLINYVVVGLFAYSCADSILCHRKRTVWACIFVFPLIALDPVFQAGEFPNAVRAIIALSPLAAFSILFRDRQSWPIRVGSTLLLGTSAAALAYNVRHGMSGIGFFCCWVE